MNTLVIYDITGEVLATMSGGEYSLVGTAVVEIPEGKVVDHVDVETGEVIFKDKAKTLEERIAELEAINAVLLGEEA